MGNKSNSSTISSSPFQQSYQNQDQASPRQEQEVKKKEVLPDKLSDDEEIIVTQKISQEKAVYDLEKGVTVDLKAKLQHIKLSEKDSQKMPILLSLKTKDSTQENQNQEEDESRAGVDLICVVDHSGSMAGEKIKLVQDTLKYLLTILNENDRLSIVIFDDQVVRLNPLQRMTQSNIDQLKTKISSITADGGTTIRVGMNLAFNMIKNRKFKNQVTSVFLLSDGQDSSAIQQTKSLLEQYKIEDAFTIKTFGFGADHDEKLMKNMAELKDGSFYYIEKLSLVDEAFVDALGGLISVIGQNVKIECQVIKNAPFSDLRVHKAFGNWTKDEETQVYKLEMNQLLSGISKDFIFELNIPPMKKQLDDQQKNNVAIFKVQVNMMDITAEKKSAQFEKTLNVTFYNFTEDIEVENLVDQQVVAEYLRVQGADILEQANKLAEQNKFEDAQKLFDQIIQEAEESDVKEKPQIKTLVADLQQSKKACQPQQYKSYGAKYMISRQMVHQNQQSSAFQMQVEDQNQKLEEMDDCYANSKQKKYVTSLRQNKKN